MFGVTLENPILKDIPRILLQNKENFQTAFEVKQIEMIEKILGLF